MGNAFGPQKTMKQIIRENKRMVERSVRQLERERQTLQRDEQKLINEIKTNAKKGQMKSVRIQAKDLVRIRKHQEKFVNLTAQLRANMQSQQALGESMKKATRSMAMLNRSMKLPALQKIMMEFQKQSEQMEMKEEMMGEAIDDAMESEEDEDEEEQVIGQVLDEIGISFADGLVDAPGKALNAPAVAVAEDDKDLEARLDNLNR